jgi:hypothetical protein
MSEQLFKQFSTPLRIQAPIKRGLKPRRPG